MHRRNIKSKQVTVKQKPAKQKLSAAQLFNQAQLAMQYDDFDSAKKCFVRALQLEPDNLEIMDAYGAFLAEIGPADEALKVLRKLAEKSPDNGFEKYMYLGQLTEGEEAIGYTQKGVSLLGEEVQKAEAEVSEDVDELRKQLSAAICSVAELKLYNANEIADVATDVEQLLNQARTAHEDSPEPLQALASLRYEQGNHAEALSLLEESLQKWFRPHNDGEEDGNDDDAMDEDDEFDPDSLPSYEFRFECAKLLLELDENTDRAIKVLEALIEEDDRNLDVWHTLGLAYYSGHEYDEAEEVVSRGLALLNALGSNADPDVVEAYEDLQSAISEAKGIAEKQGVSAQ